MGAQIERRGDKVLCRRFGSRDIQGIAAAGNGAYVRSGNSEFGLNPIIDSIRKMDAEEFSSIVFEEFDEQSTYTTYGENDTQHYVCNNCGAELITDSDTAATTCSYCGAPMILGDRLSGKMAPSKVIPFTISKNRAEEAFKKWCKNGLVTPGDFMKANRIKNITGMYVPFWLYDVNGRGEIVAHGKKVRHYTSGDYDVTETRHYNIYRKVSLNFNNIPADASEKMPDDMMDKLEPYTYGNLTDFKTPYLSGYLAEKYNYTDKELFPRIKEKTSHYIDQYVQNTMTGYTTVNYNELKNAKLLKVCYAW